ncbi:tax1-binding protein 1 homolog B-like [Dendronephthya gigantea]|uniref:tax1-binding protein 1 homolog B-like n=1 Tax=Dendronephthya gigantea TaxID=151771 RepID=UPI00106ACCB1|nr:tax1-binding protein 1 homolog B-like [Dendronephthya gigantea]
MEGAVNDSSVTSESIEESKFAGVVFHNIQEIYLPGKDIRCCYSIKPSVLATANDWIGLYKVGWQSPKEYLCYEYSPVIEKSAERTSSISSSASLSTQNSVVFLGSKLPSEECEFYQFCYVTSSGEIRGASYPFQISFSKPGELECSEEEDESGETLLIVKNRTTLLEDSLAKAYDENSRLKASKEKFEDDCLKFQDMILQLEARKSDLVSQNEKQKKLLEKVNSEKTFFEESFKETVEQLKSSQSALKLANEKTEEVQKQLDHERLCHVQTTSEQQKFEEERSQLLHVISQRDGTIQNFLDSIEENSCKAATLECEIQKIKSEKEAVLEDYDKLVVENIKTNDSLVKSNQAHAALEKSVAEQCEQVYQLQAENLVMKDELAATQKELEDMSQSFGNKQSSIAQELCKYETQIELVTSQLEGSQKELSATKEKLDDALSVLEKERKVNQEQVQEYEGSILKIQNQLDQERAFNNSLCSASDRQVGELQEQLNVQLQLNSSALKQTEKQTQEIKHLEEKITVKENEIERMKLEMENYAQELESIKKLENGSSQLNADASKAEGNIALEGSYFALKTAHEQLRKQYIQAKKDMENVWRQKADLKRQLATIQSEMPESDLRFQMANLKKQIEDLRIRLNMGAEAYKTKFKECQKYEKQLKKVQKVPSCQKTTQSPSSMAEFEIQNLKQTLENEKTTAATLKKSLENYKEETHNAREELSTIKKEKEFLQRQVATLEKEVCIGNEETQKRLVEDKELQSHIECLHNQLEAKCNALIDIEEKYKALTENNEGVIAPLSDENEKLQRALEDASNQNDSIVMEMQAERIKWKQQMEKQNALIEELKRKIGVDCVASQDDANKDNVFESTIVEKTSRGPPSTSIQPEHQCPICEIFYPPHCAQKDFEEHVRSHFDD